MRPAGVMDNGRVIKMGSPNELKSEIGDPAEVVAGERVPGTDGAESAGLSCLNCDFGMGGIFNLRHFCLNQDCRAASLFEGLQDFRMFRMMA